MTTATTIVKVPMDVKYESAWLTWVASTTTCLKALDINCDLADVAGMSGYAFTMSVHKTLCPSGPTMFNWGSLLIGINQMGRSTLNFMSGDCYSEGFRNDRTREHARRAFEFASREISEGRPVVLWGAYVPEFAVAYAVDDEHYYVKSFKECMHEEQPPIKWDAIEAPGGPYILAFPTPTGNDYPRSNDQYALSQAVQRLTDKSIHPMYGSGLDAYDYWIEMLETWGKVEGNFKHTPFGNAYNAQCYAETKHFAHAFLEKLAQRCEFAKKPLKKAVKEYGETAKAMKEVAEMFPFPGGDQLDSSETRDKAIDALKTAKKHEKKALKYIIEAVELDTWPDESPKAESKPDCSS